MKKSWRLKIPNYLNAKRPSLKYIIPKLSKVNEKGRILKASRVKATVIYKGNPIRLPSNIVAETLQTRSK